MPQLSPIVLLLGPSSSGKDTIANRLKYISTSDNLIWKEETLDAVTLAKCNDIKQSIDSDPEDSRCYQNALKLLHFSKIFQAIMLIDFSEENFSERIDAFIKQSLKECNSKIEFEPELFENVSLSLQILVLKYHNQFESFKDIFSDFITKAISNSAIGTGTIINLVPPRNEEVKSMIIDFFDETIINLNHLGPTYKFVIHCPVSELHRRMLERNQLARENGCEHDLREGIFPLKQYAKLFTTAKEESPLGSLTEEDVVSFCNTFGGDLIEQKNILNILHLGETKIGGVFFRYPGACHVFDNAQPDSSKEIAENMHLIIKPTQGMKF